MSFLGYNKRAKGGLPSPIKVENNSFISKKMNGQIISITENTVLTLSAGLSKFICEFRVSAGCMLEILIADGVKCYAVEGFLIEENNTATLTSMQEGSAFDYEIFRSRPVNNNNWSKIMQDELPASLSLEFNYQFDNYKLRIMQGEKIIFQDPDSSSTRGKRSLDLPNRTVGEVFEIWVDNPVIIFDVYSQDGDYHWFEKIDWTQYNGGLVNLWLPKDIYGLSNLLGVVNLRLNVQATYLNPVTAQQIIENFNGNELTLSYAKGDYDLITVADKENVGVIDLFNASGLNHSFVFANLPKVTKLRCRANVASNKILNFTIDNCPAVNYIEFTNYQNAPDINIDDNLIEVESYGTSNGTWLTDVNFVFTAASQAARDALAARGWQLNFNA